MILAHGLPIELFYFLGAYSLAAGAFVGAVAVRLRANGFLGLATAQTKGT
jgi:hypothetical protein